MLRTALNPHHWCVVRWNTAKGSTMHEGRHGLDAALALACKAIDDGGARSVTIFDGKPSDGAKVVARINLEGLPDLKPEEST